MLGASFTCYVFKSSSQPWFLDNCDLTCDVFCISFVVVTVKARIASLDPGPNLGCDGSGYANERGAFRYMALPLVMPGITSAAL